MILITGAARPATDARDALLAAADEVAKLTHDDDGCLLYLFATSLDGESVISAELWRDQAALDAHMQHDHTSRFLAAIDGLLDGAPVVQQSEI